MTFRQNYKMSKHSKKSVKHPGNSLVLPDITVKSLSQGGASSRLKASISENNFKKETYLKPSLSTKSWSVNQKYNAKSSDVNEENASNFQDLSIHTDSDDYDCSSNLLKARDSLENLLKTERFLKNSELKYDSPTSTSSSPDTSSPRSLQGLGETGKPTISSKSSAWESNEMQTKSRRAKEKKKKNNCNNLSQKQFQNRDFKAGDEKGATVPTSSNSSAFDNYSFASHETKPSRSVVFTNEVMVVYFNGEHILCESKEPLKKELEQQVRNKEMRKGHVISN